MSLCPSECLFPFICKPIEYRIVQDIVWSRTTATEQCNLCLLCVTCLWVCTLLQTRYECVSRFLFSVDFRPFVSLCEMCDESNVCRRLWKHFLHDVCDLWFKVTWGNVSRWRRIEETQMIQWRSSQRLFGGFLVSVFFAQSQSGAAEESLEWKVNWVRQEFLINIPDSVLPLPPLFFSSCPSSLSFKLTVWL